MIAKPLSQVELRDILELIEANATESRYLDYKSEPYKADHRGRSELCKDLSAFANADGGDLVIGVSEMETESGVSLELRPVTTESFEELRGRIQSTVDTHVQPRIGLEFLKIDCTPDLGYVAIVRVRSSLQPPHLVRFEESTKFYLRTSDGVSQLKDVFEIRDAFLHSADYEKRLRKWVEDRAAVVLGDSPPVHLYSSHVYLFHVVPMIALARRSAIDLSDARTMSSSFGPSWLGGWGSRHNFDGILHLPMSRDDGRADGYSLVFRNGSVEAAKSDLVWSQGDKHYLVPNWIETVATEAIPKFVSSLKSLNLGTPMFISQAILNVKGLLFLTDRFGTHSLAIDRDHLILPDVVVPDESTDVISTLKPAFDVLWGTGGRSRSPNFDDEGNWTPPKY